MLKSCELFCLSKCPHVCVYFSAHTYQPLPGFFLTFQSFARSCPEAQRDLLASFACKVERALSVGVRCLQTAPPLWPARLSQPAALTLPLPAGVGHDSTVRNILRSCQSLQCPDWGQPSEEQQVGKDKHDPFTKTPLSQTDKRHG